MGIATESGARTALEDRSAEGPRGAGPRADGSHERKRELWYPVRSARPPSRRAAPTSTCPNLRDQAAGIPDPVRAALALNMLTEEGLPHFHRLLAVYLGDDSHWRPGTTCGPRRRTGTARCSTTTPATPGCSTSEDRGDAVRVHPGGLPSRMGPRSLPGLRLHDGAGAGHPVLPQRDRPDRRRVRAALGRGAEPRRQGRGPSLRVLPQRLRADPPARSQPGAALGRRSSSRPSTCPA